MASLDLLPPERRLTSRCACLPASSPIAQVRETFEFSANIRLPREISKETKKQVWLGAGWLAGAAFRMLRVGQPLRTPPPCPPPMPTLPLGFPLSSSWTT